MTRVKKVSNSKILVLSADYNNKKSRDQPEIKERYCPGL